MPFYNLPTGQAGVVASTACHVCHAERAAVVIDFKLSLVLNLLILDTAGLQHLMPTQPASSRQVPPACSCMGAEPMPHSLFNHPPAFTSSYTASLPPPVVARACEVPFIPVAPCWRRRRHVTCRLQLPCSNIYSYPRSPLDTRLLEGGFSLKQAFPSRKSRAWPLFRCRARLPSWREAAEEQVGANLCGEQARAQAACGRRSFPPALQLRPLPSSCARRAMAAHPLPANRGWRGTGTGQRGRNGVRLRADSARGTAAAGRRRRYCGGHSRGGDEAWRGRHRSGLRPHSRCAGGPRQPRRRLARVGQGLAGG